jgi:uncharacterized protein YjbJ (UPF0337 family)
MKPLRRIKFPEERAHPPDVFFKNPTQEINMDKDRIKGAGNQAKGQVKETAGKILGNDKLKAEGEMDKMKGKVQSTLGGAKDKIRHMLRNIHRDR